MKEYTYKLGVRIDAISRKEYEDARDIVRAYEHEEALCKETIKRRQREQVKYLREQGKIS
jgi:hypothetical protein